MTNNRGVPFWLDREPQDSFDPVGGNIALDVAIVGAGVVGLHAAYLLRQSGLRVAIFEARQIGRQATGRSTAKVTSQHGLKYSALIRDFGRDSAKLYADANQRAVATIARLCDAMTGQAGLQEKSAYIYAEDENQAGKLRDEAEAAASLNLPAEFLADAGLPFTTEGALRFGGQYQFDPYLYLCGLAKLVAGGNVSVFENSRVMEIDESAPHRLVVNGHNVTAETVVVSTQMPIVSDGLFFARAFPFAHPVAAAPLPANVKIDGMYISAGNPSHSFRTAMKGETAYLIAAGGEFKTGKQGAAEKAIDDMRQFLEQNFGVWEPTHLWINEDFRPMDGLAFVGPASSAKPSLLVATGFEAWGITQGVVAGDILAARILGQHHPCAELFDSTRIKPIAGGATFVSENIKTATHLISERVLGARVSDIDDIAPGEGGVIRHVGEQLAVRKSKSGLITAHSAICTHLGCVVGWNPVDRTWDCSCHGSRFDADGEVLSGPAVRPLEPRIAPAVKQRS